MPNRKPTPDPLKTPMDGSSGGNAPIEPGRDTSKKIGLLRWLLFAAIGTYFLVSYFHAPILKAAGGYLLVEHPPEKADLIVCLTGQAIDRGLEAAELYKSGYAPRIFIGREELPEGYELLRSRGFRFPETRDLFFSMVQFLGVPEAAMVTTDRFVGSTIVEAQMVSDLVREKSYHSLIIVTSPLHTRRAWLTFKCAFAQDQVKLMMVPSRYSDFRADDWWKTRRHIRDLVIEYQKLVFYVLKYGL